ncbi:hypothetical protein V495_03245 [Pseudogymnoascus sp. VKM F-4514 (FW-929)]|nr:hypothetical protein V495_03245 [Pseudogymnoascus sp. VKM F-4514 (FW-929)]KFY59161.1 hypothetical protein V497_04489 [Pseudogymnoascus sp. VKM F-4516 (FW-969)]
MDETTPAQQVPAAPALFNESRRIQPGPNPGREAHHSHKLTMENNSPLLLPSGLNSMLKNTTETGDIGIFSIKPSRLPRHPAITRAAGRTRSNGGNYRRGETQLPYHGPRVFSLPSTIDDRSRLSSYGRDATSEIASLYEVSSQKSSESSKVVEDQDRRSYSMTLSSFSGYRLANPHSSTSLSSQIDQNEAQRPRSSFQYPARLKRPGFRPSSPALTDGGAVDYSRRVEIQRDANSPNCQNVSLRPLSLRSDVNRSTPTATGQSHSPHGFKPISVVQRDDAPGECSNNTEISESASKVNSDPASYTNSHFPNRMAASGPIQNKPHYSSPLYYDYTENFFNEVQEGNHATEELEGISPPPFLVEKTIHEDRELSSDWSYLAMTDLQGRGFLATEQPFTPHEDTKNLPDQPADISYVGGGKLPSQGDSESVPEYGKHNWSLESANSPTVKYKVGSTNANQSPPQSIESGPGVEMFKMRNLVGEKPTIHIEPESQRNEAIDEVSLSRNSPCAASPHFQQVSSPPSGVIRTFANSSLPIGSQGASIHDVKGKPLSHEGSETDKTEGDDGSGNKLGLTPTQTPQSPKTAPILQRSVSAQNKRDKSSPCFRGRPNSTSSSQSDMKLEVSKPATQPWDLSFNESNQNYAEFPDINQNSSMPLQSYKHSFQHSQMKFPARKYKSDGNLAVPRNEFTSIQTAGKSNQHGDSKVDFGQAESCDKTPLAGGRDDFRLASVVSPIPLYPGKQFLIPSTTDDSKPQPMTPALLETTLSEDTPISLSKEKSPAEPTTQHFFAKFRLKTGAYTVRPKPSPLITQRRKLDGSYPLDDRRTDVSPVSLRRPVNLAPKLKLKVARASASPLGTVIINREAAVQADLGGSEILSPEDLFTPPPRLASLFRQVSRHFRPKDDYEEINAPDTTNIGELDGTGLPFMSSSQEHASTIEARMNGPYPQILPRSSQFVGILSSPYPLVSQEPVQDRMSPETPSKSRQIPHDSAVIQADVQAGGAQSCFSDYGPQLEESSHLQSNIPSLRTEQPSHHLEAGKEQALRGAAWVRDAWDQFQSLDLADMDDESDHAPDGPSHRLKTTVNGWLKGIKATMFGCGRPRR